MADRISNETFRLFVNELFRTFPILLQNIFNLEMEEEEIEEISYENRLYRLLSFIETHIFDSYELAKKCVHSIRQLQSITKKRPNQPFMIESAYLGEKITLNSFEEELRHLSELKIQFYNLIERMGVWSGYQEYIWRIGFEG